MTRVAVYLRVSTTEQAKEGFSLDAQLDSLRAYCKAREWEVAQEYIDDGYSGRNIKRPAYKRMMEENGQWDMILVVKMDRIHRNSKNFMEMMDDLRRWAKDFSSIQESLDTSSAIGRFVVDIIQRIAQLESEQIGERVYVGMRQKASTVGGILGFNAPYGYEFMDQKLIPKEGEAEVVREIFYSYLGGKSAGEISLDLTKKNVPTKRGGRWSCRTISGILRNPIYCGYLRWNGNKGGGEVILYKADHEAIIDVEIFNAVQTLLDKRAGKRKRKSRVRIGEELLEEIKENVQEEDLISFACKV